MSSNGTTTTTRLLLTCGPGLHSTKHGDILVLDWKRKTILDSIRFQHSVYPESHKGLAGASWNGRKLLVAAECELLEFSVAPLRLAAARSFPYLNDVHHLAARNGRIWVCNTGLDCLEVYDSQWQLLETRDLLGSIMRRLRYSYTSLYFTIKRGYEQLRRWRQPYHHLPHSPALRNTRKLLRKNAYRRKESELRFSLFRPHILHPNHVLVLDRDVWITFNTTGEIASLESGRILASGLGRSHDGIVEGREHFVTDAGANRIVVHEFRPEVPDLGPKLREKIVTSSRSEGFLRGLAVKGDRIFAGLTVRRGPQQSQAARIIELDRRTLERVDEWSIPAEFGKSVYSILDATSAYDETTLSATADDAGSVRQNVS
jgi:hypothetical protein